MSTAVAPRLAGLRRSRDVRQMALLTFSQAGGRALAFLYYLLAARLLAPEGFGVFQYTIALGTLAFAVHQVLVTAIGRELGAARADLDRTDAILGASLAGASVLWGASALVCAVAWLAGITGSASFAGLLFVLSGFAVQQTYYAVARGVGDVRRMAWSYAGGAVVQLAVLGVLAVTLDPDPTLALIVFGASSAVPIVFYELWSPIVRGRRLPVDRATMRKPAALCVPLLGAQVGYLVWNAVDQVWVESVFTPAQMGVYGAAKNLSQLFIVLPAGVCGILLPRVAELQAAGELKKARDLTLRATAGTAALSLAAAFVVVAIRHPLLETLYGSDYSGAAPALVGLCVGMTLYAAFVTLTQAAVGWGRPSVYLVGITVPAVLEVVYLVAIGGDEPSVAAWAFAGSMAVGLLTVVAWLWIRPLGGNQIAQGGAE